MLANSILSEYRVGAVLAPLRLGRIRFRLDFELASLFAAGERPGPVSALDYHWPVGVFEEML